MISKMKFVQIVGPRALFARAVDEIQRSGMLQIEEVPLAAAKGDTLLHRTQLTAEQVKLRETYKELAQTLDEEIQTHMPRALSAQLVQEPAFERLYSYWDEQDDVAVGSAARALHAEVRSAKRRERNLNDDLRVLTGYEEVVTALVPLLGEGKSPDGHESVGVILEGNAQKSLRLIERQMDKLTAGEHQVLQASLSKGRVAALIRFERQ
jgi:vacuolar-type H+-ATPase subunit I/STV1